MFIDIYIVGGLVVLIKVIAVILILSIIIGGGGALEEVEVGVSRGGAWNTQFDEATCFSRKSTWSITDSKLIGFRCVKEVDPLTSA